MGIYKTYQEAVIANGSTEGVVTTRDDWKGNDKYRGCFNFQEEHSIPGTGKGSWRPCNPADHLETLADFLASGKRLIEGDLIIDLSGQIHEVKTPRALNESDIDDFARYTLKAAAYENIESPEEREAFDAMTDAKPQQFESLSKSEWKKGDGCSYYYREGEEWLDGVYVILDNGFHVIRDLDDGGYYGVTSKHLRKPETPEQRAERERWEAAEDLMLKAIRSSAKPGEIPYGKTIEITYPGGWIDLVDITGYRK